MTTDFNAGMALLDKCQYCRNSILYLAGPWPGIDRFLKLAKGRISLLPDRHNRNHMTSDNVDAAMPILWSGNGK